MKSFLCSSVAVSALLQLSLLAHSERVSFPSDQGWTLYATLTLPDGAETRAVGLPGVVLLHTPGFDRGTYAAFMGLLEMRGVASLSVDWRGSGESLYKGELELPYPALTPSDRAGIYRDVMAAIDFLAGQKGVDPKRIGLVGSRLSANHAVLAGVADWRVRSLVLFSGIFEKEALSMIHEREDLPVLCLAGKEDTEGFENSVQFCQASGNHESELLIPPAGGYGTTVMSYNTDLAEDIADWLVDKLKKPGYEQSVQFQSDDGWTLEATLHLPDDLDATAKIPGVVLVHGARHDQQTYYRLAPLMVKRGMAALRLDWRGRGKSRMKNGKRFEGNMVGGERNRVYLDVQAGINFLADQEGVDSEKIGVIGATFSTNQSLLGSRGDPRVRALVMVSTYVLDPKARDYLSSEGSPPVLFLASEEDTNHDVGSLAQFTVDAYELSSNRHSRLLMYEGYGRGTAMFHVDSGMEPMIANWMSERLVGGD